MRGGRLAVAAVFTALVVWAMYTPRPPQPLYPIRESVAPTKLGTAFDPARSGTVRGAVQWAGDVPAVPPIEQLHAQVTPSTRTTFPNPNAPHVKSGRLTDAIVFLSGIDPRRSAPWNLPPASIDAMRTGFVVRQGDRAGRAAVVRRGEAVELAAREADLHSIRGRGVAFFTQMLPDADRPVSRTLSDAGIVELSSGSGYYWLRAYLLVSDHPYAAVTGPDGGFDFHQVPDGEYEAVCWVANWHVEREENDPEWVVPVRLHFRRAVEKRQRVRVKASEVTDLAFALSAAEFKQPAQAP